MTKPERKAPAGTIAGPCLDTTWQTPPELLEPVRAYFGGVIPFDAATSPDNPTGADLWCSAEDDGLAVNWTAPKALIGDRPWGVFVNPPYGRVLRDWLGKIASEADRGTTIIALLPCARWEQEYFQDALTAGGGHAVCYIRKRVAFIRPSTGDRVGGNPYSSMFVGWNVDPARFSEHFSPVGAVFHQTTLAKCPRTVRRTPAGSRRADGTITGRRAPGAIGRGRRTEAPDPNAPAPKFVSQTAEE